jgi:hypothetical protein
MAKGPVLFDLEGDTAPRPSVADAPVVVDLPEQDAPQGQAMQIAARLAARKPSRLIRLFWTGVDQHACGCLSAARADPAGGRVAIACD